MARGARSISIGTGAGVAVAVLVLALVFGTLGAVFWRAGGLGTLGAAEWAAVRFTVLQATLSAGLSVLLAIPVARALARRRFVGRSMLVTLLGAPFILPTIVAILGLLAVFGRRGLFNTFLGHFGFGPVSIYGLQGVLLAHVFFNLPLATRLILQGWQEVPSERFRLAASLGMSGRDIRRFVERPMLRQVVPGVFVVIFVICMTSFAVALTLGGGPKATTVELAIYQAFRFDFDLGKAAVLSVVQFGLSAVAAGLAVWAAMPAVGNGGLDRVVQRFDAGGMAYRVIDAAWISLAALFLLLPLGMVLFAGIGSIFSLPEGVWAAAVRSVVVAVASAFLALALALPLAIATVRLRRGAGAITESIGALSIAASPLVMGTGAFILLFPIADPVALALPVTGLVNAVMSLPFAMRALVPALREVEASYGRLADSLGMTGWARLRLLLVPRLRRPLGFAGGLAAALSMGDLGVIALFADPSEATLPLQLYRLMSSYRMDQAAGAALVLLGLSLALFWVFDRGGRVDADA